MVVCSYLGIQNISRRYVLLRSKSTFLNRSRGHLSLCCYRCFIKVLALNFFLERSNLKKKWSMCVCIDHRLLLCTSFSRYGKETTKSYTTLADLDINFHYPNHGHDVKNTRRTLERLEAPATSLSSFRLRLLQWEHPIQQHGMSFILQLRPK